VEDFELWHARLAALMSVIRSRALDAIGLTVDECDYLTPEQRLGALHVVQMYAKRAAKAQAAFHLYEMHAFDAKAQPLEQALVVLATLQNIDAHLLDGPNSLIDDSGEE
jgi:hypothetical protein